MWTHRVATTLAVHEAQGALPRYGVDMLHYSLNGNVQSIQLLNMPQPARSALHVQKANIRSIHGARGRKSRQLTLNVLNFVFPEEAEKSIQICASPSL